jgi:hypothetical protein
MIELDARVQSIARDVWILVTVLLLVAMTAVAQESDASLQLRSLTTEAVNELDDIGSDYRSLERSDDRHGLVASLDEATRLLAKAEEKANRYEDSDEVRATYRRAVRLIHHVRNIAKVKRQVELIARIDALALLAKELAVAFEDQNRQSVPAKR